MLCIDKLKYDLLQPFLEIIDGANWRYSTERYLYIPNYLLLKIHSIYRPFVNDIWHSNESIEFIIMLFERYLNTKIRAIC